MAHSSPASDVAMASSESFPPLPAVPEPPIFDASYYLQLLAVMSDSSFPSTTPAEEIYNTRLRVINAIIAARRESSLSLSINLMVTWAAMALMCGFLIVRIRRNRQRALSGDAGAARGIVLPAFEPLLWLLGGSNVAFLVAYGTLLVERGFVVNHNRFTMELVVDVKLMNALLVPIYMLQPSLSARALRRAVGHTLAVSMYTLPVVLLLNTVATRDNQRLCYWLVLIARVPVGLYVLYLVVLPPARASACSFRFVCLYIVSMQLMMFWMAEVYHRGHTGKANIVAAIITTHSTLLPLCVWFILRADTEHWRGLGKRAVELQEKFRRKKGKIDEHLSSQGLHVLIELHRKFIIDFARLQVRDPVSDTTRDGQPTTVYRGFLHTKKIPVAIKVYMPADFTEETVAEFSHEAALCGALVHPNILKFHGLCVCPPNICLLTELCKHSLQDVASRVNSSRSQSSPHRHQLFVSIGYIIDAARALAYLHSFSPPFVHGEIKPSSFLIDDVGTVKLMDFGASRTRAVRPSNDEIHQPHAVRAVLEIDGTIESNLAAQYVAPEVIRAHHAGAPIYSEAADVFSLAMVMWDVFHPGQVKYPGKVRHSHERKSLGAGLTDPVIAGHRPLVSPDIDPRLAELIQAAWQSDPLKRPTIQAVVAVLEGVQEALCAPFALELMNRLNGMTKIQGAHLQSSFAGKKAVEKLLSSQSVDSESEAIRVGNMLMDCGFLHHTKHMRAFEGGSYQYVFDTDQICCDLRGSAGIDQCHRWSGRSSVEEYASCPELGSSRDHESEPARKTRCACRKLGQRLETALTTQRRFRVNFRAFSTEYSLTAKLLADDEERPSGVHFTTLTDPLSQHNRGQSLAQREVDVVLESV